MDLSIKGVMEFLHRFGYLSLPNDFESSMYPKHAIEGRLGNWNEAARGAMARYQHFHGLPVSLDGTDERTLAQMCQRRCGHPDNIYGVAQQVMKWRKTNLTWKVINQTGDVPDNYVSAAFNAGYAGWSGCTPLTFTEVLANQDADITIVFKRLDTKGQVLAQAWFPEDGRMEFDDSEDWSWVLPIGRGQVDLATVVMHEAGHLIGLEHSTVRGAQMAPVYAGPKRFLEQDDITRAQSIYGAKP